MGTWTIYSAGGDLTLLNAIFNGVAMICAQNSLVWGFALLASLWQIVSGMSASAIQTAGGHPGGVLAQGSYSAIMPLILAMLLTAPGAQCTVQVQSNLTGAVTSVANVPFVVAAIPVGGSIMAQNIGTAVTTAFGSANASYDTISASGNGFLDPMKRLLGARSGVQRLGALDSELQMLMSQCIGPSVGTDFQALNNLVLNAGNSGATATQSLAIYGASPTGIGAMLYQASLNTTGLVPALSIGNPTILNCTDAATQVQTDINNALASGEFARVVQGAVNGLDQPQSGASYGIDQMATEYTALRQWNSVGATLGSGTQQTNAEMINFLFAEEVANGLNCSQASGSDKATCEANLIQATELERNNVQAAANEVPMLQYAGSFGNYILALVIGLGPVIVMFMMFAGVAAGKCVKTAVHILVWPLLVTNVGAELVNAMITLQFSNFLASIAQSGYLSPATMLSAYKELSLQVGVGSHIMASLPVLMSMIFALGETAGLVSVAKEVQPQGREVGENMAPSPVGAAPLARMSSPVTVTQGIGFHDVKASGSTDAVSSSSGFASMARDASRTVTETDARETRESQEISTVRRTADALARRDYHSLGLTETQGEALRRDFSNNLSEIARTGGSTSIANGRTSNTGADIAASADGSAGVSLNPGNLGSATVGVRAGTFSSANDTHTLTNQVSKAHDVDVAKALSKTLSSDAGNSVSAAHGSDGSRSLNAEKSAAESYVESVTHRDANTTAVGSALKSSDSYLAAQQSIHAPEIANYVVGSGDFRQFQRMEGSRFESGLTARRYMAEAERDMTNMDTDAVGGNPAARQAVLRHAAAVNMARDTSLPEAERYGALKYLTGETNAMLHQRFAGPSGGEFQSGSGSIPLPVNKTGVSGNEMIGRNERALSGERSFKSSVEWSPGERTQFANAVDEAIPGLSAPSASGTRESFAKQLAKANEQGLGSGENHESTLRRAAEGAAHSIGDLVGDGVQQVVRLISGGDDK